MQLERGYRFCVASRFANALAWNARLQVAGPAEQSRAGEPEVPWQPIGESECGLLVNGETSDDAWRRDVCLFAIPEHLRSRWWTIAALQVEGLPARGDGMTPFAREVVEFAQFKRIPLPQQCGFAMTVSPPDPAADDRTVGSLSATTVERFAWAAEPLVADSPVIARINLGDERTALIFLNLGRVRTLEMLETQAAGRISANPIEADDPVREFLAKFPDYPLVRLLLEPGEGVWLPSADVVCGSDRSGKTDIDVWLNLKDEGGRMKAEG